MDNSQIVRRLAPGLCVLVVLLAGCVGPQVKQPMRAIWVTRFDYKTAADVARIMENCSSAGFNVVVFQVRGNGTAFYKSSFEPWADELGGTDPGFDPLEIACHEAHERGVELHAWVNALPAWRGTKPPTNPEQLYNKHPEWFWYDQKGERQALCSFYVSLNPCLPEVRQYLVDVFREVVANYDVDGLHLDYIRYPNEPPATPPGSGIDYSYDAPTLALYRSETGLAPDDNRDRWNQWRTDQVTKLVAEIQKMMRQARPTAALTASIGSVRENALRHFQDGRAWIDRALVDAVILMNYTDTAESFAARIDPWMAKKPRVPVVPGLWFGGRRDRTPEEVAQIVKQQIEIAREKTGNFCVFSYASLFDSADEKELTDRSERQQKARQARRDVLLPFLAGLAE